MLLLMLVSLYTSRVILSELGIDNYGIYNLIAGFITLFSFISTSLVGAMQRFFNYALGNKNYREYQLIYSMGYNIFAIFSILLVVIGETVGLWFVKYKLNIPVGRENAAMWVYQISLITLIVNLFRTPDNASIIAHERMKFYAYISILEAAIKLSIVFCLEIISFDKLILYVLLYLFATIIINVIYKLYCNREIKECRYHFTWDKEMFKRLVSFSGWNMLTGGAHVIKSQGENILINQYYSVAVNAAFGVAAQVYNVVNLFLTNFQTAYKPQLIQTYAANEHETHRKLAIRSARMSYFLLLIIIIPVAFNLKGLLHLWLTDVPQYTTQFCLFILVAYLVDTIGAPLAVSVQASGHIRGMQICTSIILILGLLMSFILLFMGAVPYIVAILTLFVHVFFLLCYIYYAHKFTNFSIRNIIKAIIIPSSFIGLISILLPLTLYFLHITGWWLLLICLIDALWTLMVIYFIGINHEERSYVKLTFFNFTTKLFRLRTDN